MAQARRETTAGGPAGWVILLGLMVLALVIAAISKGCETDDTSPASQQPTPSTATGTSTTGAAQALDVINQINGQIKTGGVTFVAGKSELTPSSRATLDKVATLLTQNATLKAEVVGYTDNQGDAAKNQQISLDRAQAVKDYLVGKGIAAGRLAVRGLGEANPIAPNDTEAGRAQNRRVEFAPG